MRIGIIGAGNIGSTLAKLFANAGHEVVISNSRGPETLSDLVDEIGPNARAVTFEEAADFGEVVFEAIPFGRYEDLPVDRLRGKVFVDASNYYPQRDGEIALDGLGSSEVISRHLTGARVVKAFNTMYYERLINEARPDAPVDERLVVFVAGDDGEAKGLVSGLIQEVGLAPVDTGSLEDGRKQQPGSPIYNVPMKPAQAHEMLARG